jgi:hypothetical protein
VEVRYASFRSHRPDGNVRLSDPGGVHATLRYNGRYTKGRFLVGGLVGWKRGKSAPSAGEPSASITVTMS